jgi:hypothetical protein
MKRILLGRHAPLGVTLLVAALAVGACGGDKDDEDDDDSVGVGGTNGDGDGDGDGDGVGGSNTGGSNTGGNGAGGNGAGGSPGGEGGMGGDDSGTGGETSTCEVMGDVADFVVAVRQTGNSWDHNDFDAANVTVSTDDCDIVSVSALWPHEAAYQDDDPAEANFESTQFTLDTVTAADMTGKTLTLVIKLVDDGRGNEATNGGYNVNIGATDANYTEFATSYDLDQTGELYGAGDEATVTLAIPSDVTDFTPDDLYKIFIRIENKFWGDGTDPVFAYDTAVFEISEWSVTDTP